MKNVVFDIGNVVVRWSPPAIVQATFGDIDHADQFVTDIFKHELWLSLNRGEVSEAQAKSQYAALLNQDSSVMDRLFHHIKDTQILVDGTVALMTRLNQAGYTLYALTDNVHEIVAHLRERYDFWDHFAGVVVSAEVQLLKPSAAIFQHLLDEHQLQPEETVFIDDVAANVAGAEHLGIHGIQFESSSQCEQALKSAGLVF